MKDELLYLDYPLPVEEAHRTLDMDETCGAHISTWHTLGDGTTPQSRIEK
jgi:hypothetical protein